VKVDENGAPRVWRGETIRPTGFSGWRGVAAAALLAAVIALPGLSAFALFDVDEAVFSEATREMVASGDYGTPRYNGANRFDKPILFYWIQAASFRVLGISELSARLPSAIAAILLALACHLFARRLWGEREALRAAAALVLCPFFLVYSHAAVTDMMLTLFIAASIFAFAAWGDEPDSPAGRWGLRLFYVFAALALLTKGLIGVLIPAGTAVWTMILSPDRRRIWKAISPSGILLFLAIAVPWHAAMLSLHGDAFTSAYFGKHHFARYTSVISGHTGPVWYYLPVLAIGFFPWIARVPEGAAQVWKSRRMSERTLVVWAALVVLFFSFSSTKLPNYVLPAVPALALLAGRARAGRLAAMSAGAVAALLAVGAVVAWRMEEVESLAIRPGLAVAAAAMAGLAVAAWSGARRDPFWRLAPAAAAFLLAVVFGILPAVNRRAQGTLRDYALQARETLPAGGTLFAFRINAPSVSFYARRIVRVVPDAAALAGDAPAPALAIAKTADAAEVERAGFRRLKDDGTYALLERAAR
jgi:4-amino-4-deoxy-L-arabinose transferase-like glycosyltransferase